MPIDDTPRYYRTTYTTDPLDPIWTVPTTNAYTTTNDYTIHNTLQYEPYTFHAPGFVTKDELDNFAKRIYEIITEHTSIDITEKEFLKILRGE